MSREVHFSAEHAKKYGLRASIILTFLEETGSVNSEAALDLIFFYLKHDEIKKR